MDDVGKEIGILDHSPLSVHFWPICSVHPPLTMTDGLLFSAEVIYGDGP